MSMILRIIFIISFAGVFASEASDNVSGKKDPLSFMQTLIARDDLTKDVRFKELETYLKGLDKATYLKFLRGVDKAEGIFKGEEDRQLSMFFFARWYLESLAKKDDILVNLGLVKDRTLPWRWRWALLDILKPEENRDLTMADVSSNTKMLRDVSKDENEDDGFRYSLIEKNGSILLTQLELVAEKIPNLKQRIIARDQSVLEESEIQGHQKLKTSVATLFQEGKMYEEHLKMICNDDKKLKLQGRGKSLLKEWQSWGGKKGHI